MNNLKKYIEDNNITNSDKLAESLLADFNIKCRVEEDQAGDNLYTFKYDQINSPKSDKVVQECRGIILDSDLNLVFKGFNRFFNVGEMLEVTENFNWGEFETFEKADGSLIKVYYHNGYWQIGTNGTALARVSMNNDGWGGDEAKLFRDEVIKCFGFKHELDFQENAHKAFLKGLNYVFEFTSPENRIVTPYKSDQMVLLSIFRDGVELDSHDVNEIGSMMSLYGLNIRPASCYRIKDKDQLYEMVSSLTGLQEGFVLKDSNGMRLKVKSDLYVAAHRMRGESGLTLKKACELVLMGEQDEYLVYFPDESDKIRAVEVGYNNYLESVESEYLKHSGIQDKKEFALAVKESPHKHLFFTMKRDSISAKEAFSKVKEGSKLKTLMEVVA